MRVIVGALTAGVDAGPGVYLRSVATAITNEYRDVELAVHLISRKGDKVVVTAATGHLPTIVTPLPASLLRPTQRWLRVPPMRALVGRYDLYHQVHLDADPAVSGRSLVLTMHDCVAMRWPREEGGLAPFAGRLLRRAAAVITVSEFSRREIVSNFDLLPEHVHVALNGVDHARFQPLRAVESVQQVRDRICEGRPYVLATGAQTPRKNLARIFRAFDVFCRRTNYAGRLVVVGSANLDLAGVRSAAARLGERLCILGHVRAEALPGIYAAADALLYPSLYEGFGLPVLEAFASGTRVITSEGTACEEVAGGVAVLVDPQDVESIADGLADLFSEDEASASRRVAAGISRSRNFSWERSAAAHVDAYRAALARGKDA